MRCHLKTVVSEREAVIRTNVISLLLITVFLSWKRPKDNNICIVSQRRIFCTNERSVCKNFSIICAECIKIELVINKKKIKHYVEGILKIKAIII